MFPRKKGQDIKTKIILFDRILNPLLETIDIVPQKTVLLAKCKLFVTEFRDRLQKLTKNKFRVCLSKNQLI